jgi:TPR repeat protein
MEEQAKYHRIQGNELFKEGNYIEAIKSYTAGIKINPRCPALFTNRATCYMKLRKPLGQIISDCDASISLDKTWWRAFQRKAEALEEHGKYDDAESVLTSALDFNADKDHLRAQLDSVRSKLRISKNLQAPFGSNSSNFREVMLNMMEESDQRTKPPRDLSSAQKGRILELEKIHDVSQKACALEMSGQTEKAIGLYEKSALAGCTLSMAALGRIFHHGEGLKKPDFDRGIFWLTKCVEHGPSELALLLCNGHDPALSSAQGCLGQAFRHGIGVEQDAIKAETLLRCSAEGGDFISMNNLGSLLSCHENSNSIEGFRWYLRAAESGYSLAMVNIGVCMMRGQGTQRDVQGARGWLLKAKAAGEPHASALLAELEMTSGGSPEGVVAKLEAALAAERKFNHVCVQTLLNLVVSLFEWQEHEDDALSHVQVDAELGQPRELGKDVVADSQPEAAAGAGQGLAVRLSRRHAQRLLELKQARPVTRREARAVSLLQEAVKAGSADAALRLGRFHLFKGLDEDALAVFLALSRAQNHCEASFMAGVILTRRGRPSEAVSKGLRLLVKAGEQGHAEAAALVRSLQEGGEAGARLAGAIAGGSSAGLAGDSDVWSTEPDDRSSVGVKGDMGSETSEAPAQSASGPEAAVPAHADLDDAFRLLQASLEGDQKPCTLSDHMKNPSARPNDHLATMERYVAARPESYTGRLMLHALRHFAGFQRLWNPARPGPALEQLFLAFALDEKAVTVTAEFHRDAGSGAMRPTEDFSEAYGAVERRYRADPGDVQAALLHAMLRVVPGADSCHNVLLAGLNRAVTIGLGAPPESLAGRLLPRFLSLRAAAQCFRGEAQLGLADFERCLELLQSGNGASLAPHMLEGLPGDLRSRLREVELRCAVLHVGRARLLLDRLSQAQARAAAEEIRAFIDHVPRDTHYFVNAHYELIGALLAVRVRPGPEDVRALIARADAAMDDHIPIFSRVSEEDFPKMAQARALLRLMELAQAAQVGRGSGGRTGSGRGGAEKGDAGRGATDLEEEVSERVGASGCWRCGQRDAAGGLKLCRRCSTARYCCRECQVAGTVWVTSFHLAFHVP